MPKPTRWIAGWLAFRLTLVPTVDPSAWADPRSATDTDAVRASPHPGSICFAPRAERPSGSRDRWQVRPLPLTTGDLGSGDDPAPAALQLLQDAGISPSGIDPAVWPTILQDLRASRPLRQAFRDVLGDSMSTGLEAILRKDRSTPVRALVVGNSVIVPSSADVPGPPADSLSLPAATAPEIVDLEEYTRWVEEELALLEADQLRYLQSAARANRTIASVRGVARSLRRLGEPDERIAAARQEAAEDSVALVARLRTLQTELGVHPEIERLARDKVDQASAVRHQCEEAALRYRRWIHLGAGGVAGLVGAAGIVVAYGATGTMGGGIVIAAALEASLGAYLMYRTERTGFAEQAEEAQEKKQPRLPEEGEKRTFAADGDAELSRGRTGEGRGDPAEELQYEAQAAEDWSGGEGEGELDESELDAALEPRENLVPPILPPTLPEDILELPPLLDTDEVRELRDLSLAEIQQRLDEFLALDAPPAAPGVERPSPPLQPSTVQQLIEEARAALQLWKERHELSPAFGEFFLKAELEEAPADRRPEVFSQASRRFSVDQAAYRSSSDLEELRKRMAARLVTNCRAAGARGDLVQAGCTDETALAILVVSAIQHAGVSVPYGSVLGVQARGSSFHPVVFFPASREVLSLISGDRVKGVVGPLYHPASFYYSFLVEHGVRPDIDPERHLLIAPADPGMEQPVSECAERRSRGVVGRVVDWLRSLVGAGIPSRRGSRCPGTLVGSSDEEAGEGQAGAESGGGEGSGDSGSASGGEASRAQTRRRGVSISISGPRIPSPRSGGGQSGGGGQGGGGGGSGGAKSGGQSGGGGQSGSSKGSDGAGSGDQAGGAQSGGSGKGGAAGKGAGSSGQGGESGKGGAGGQGGGASGTGEHGYVAAGGGRASGDAEGAAGSGSGGGEGAAGAAGSSTDLGEVARQTVAMRRKQQKAEPIRVRPWRLRADYGYVAPSSRVLFADNEQALSRFDPGERFITLSPSEDEEQRRMQEADSFPVFPVGTGCGADDLPPRRVFRRASDGEPGFRYVFCDQDESTVVFRTRDDARSFAGLNGPDRPLYLVRLASERLATLERSPEIARIRAFLDDPNVLRELTTEEVDSMVKAAGTLLIFQQTLESALVQTMEELEGGAVRAHYYDMHRQVLQAPLFLTISAASYRLNRRLASDPLQALSWANALPPEARQSFFRLYYLFGAPVRWPDRWQVLGQRFGVAAQAREARSAPGSSLDFLQILSDPTRVQVEWRAEPRASRPSIRDRKFQKGKERTVEQRPHPSEAEKLELQDRIERTRGGTRGKGKTGEGDSAGPEKGRQPLQMIRIRMTPEVGEPDRPKVPSNNRTRPGGTRGRKKSAEESATRQEPILRVAPETFVDAVLSTWDRRRPGPEAADRVPPVLRLNQRLREVFLRDMDRDEIYDGRLLGMMGTFTSGGWLRFQETRAAMGGSWVRVRAEDTGRFAAKYARTAPINDQDQIRSPNFFSEEGVVLPADLFEPLRKRYAPGASAIFDLAAEPDAGDPPQLRKRALAPDDPQGEARENLLRTLELIREQSKQH